jgi:hypothetical protein
MESEIMHEIGEWIKTRGGVADHVPPRLPARLIARDKSTINAGRNAILSGKSQPREIFGKMLPGLRLNVEAPLKDDMEKVLAVLQQGLASSEHKDFVERLTERNL